MFTNKAAWQPSQKASSLKVEIAPYTPPSRDMIVVKNAAVAINPIDSLIQSHGDIMFTYLKYPFILGCDIAREVVEWRWARTLVAFKSVIEFWDSEGVAVETSTTQQRVLFSTIVIFARTSHA
jgi:hypothetical protein